MQRTLVAIAVVLLALWLAGKIIVGMFHFLGWLIHIAPWIALILIIVAVVRHRNRAGTGGF